MRSRKALLQCLALTGIGTIRKITYPVVATGEFRKERATSVGATVIDQQNLPVALRANPDFSYRV